MKSIKALFVLVAFVSLNAIAALAPSEIGKLIDAGQLTQAETALQEVLKTHDVAKVHYMLAQVYQQQRRSLDAKNELAKADSMDPAHSYTSNDKYQVQASKILGTATVAAQASRSPVPASSQSKATDSGASIGAIVFYFGVGCGLGLIGILIFSFVQKRKEATAAKEALDNDINVLQTRVANLVQSVETMLLSEKTSAQPTASKIDAFNTVKRKVLDLYERVKNDAIETATDCAVLLNECRSLEQLLSNVADKSYTVVAPGTSVESSAIVPPKREQRRRQSSGKSTWTQQEDSRPPAPPAQRPQSVQHETVIVNNGSSIGDVLATSILIDSMTHSRDRDDQLRERENERRDAERAEARREQQREDDRRAREEREEESRRSSSWAAPSSDSGSSSFWSSSSSSDSGSSDSWSSSSSSDSGSSDSWSSSD